MLNVKLFSCVFVLLLRWLCSWVAGAFVWCFSSLSVAVARVVVPSFLWLGVDWSGVVEDCACLVWGRLRCWGLRCIHLGSLLVPGALWLLLRLPAIVCILFSFPAILLYCLGFLVVYWSVFEKVRITFLVVHSVARKDNNHPNTWSSWDLPTLTASVSC